MKRFISRWGLLCLAWVGVWATYHFRSTQAVTSPSVHGPACPSSSPVTNLACSCATTTREAEPCPEDADWQEEQRTWQERAYDDLPEQVESELESPPDPTEDEIHATRLCAPLGEGMERTVGCQHWARLVRSCEKGNTQDCVYAALFRWDDESGMPKDPAGTVQRLRRLCEQPNGTIWNARACFALGQIYENKRPGSADWFNPTEALRVLAQGCPAQGVADSDACYELARLQEGNAADKENQPRMMELMIRSCQAQTVPYPSSGCRWLGYRYAQELLRQ